MFDYLQAINSHREELLSLRRDFHAHPELGYHEFRTSKVIQHYLRTLGLTPQVVTETGVVATIYGGKPGPTILLRADIDALPQDEATGLPFASQNPGVMHACGHDGHIAALLITAKILCGVKHQLKGNVKLVFQPNEEEAGAKAMIKAGVLDAPRVDMAFALHVWSPLKSGTVGVATGAVMAALDHFEILVEGKSGHTSSPHEAIDPIPAACQIVSMSQHVQTRALNPLDSCVILFGEIRGGSAPNIIAGQVKLTGTIRYLFKDESSQKPIMRKSFEDIVAGISQAYGVRCEIKYTPSNPSMSNDAKMVELVRKAAVETVGENNVVTHFSMGGEDFAEFSHKVPSCFFFVGAGDEAKGTNFPHHHECFDIDEDSLATGAEIFLRLVIGQLGD